MRASSFRKFLSFFESNKESDSGAIFFKGHYLPINSSNEALDSNAVYFNSTVGSLAEVERFVSVTPDTMILGLGCGQGRSANEILVSERKTGGYSGVDTHEDSIEWCREWIAKEHKGLSFEYLDDKNSRYNPSAGPLKKLPFGNESVDLIVLNSVFSHMVSADIRFYLSEFKRVLRNSETLYCAAFIDENVKDETENPEYYDGKNSSGPLHRVVNEKKFFLGLIESTGFGDIGFEFQAIERTLQSVITARV